MTANVETTSMKKSSYLEIGMYIKFSWLDVRDLLLQEEVEHSWR